MQSIAQLGPPAAHVQCNARLEYNNVYGCVRANLIVNTNCGTITIFKMVLVLPMQLHNSGPSLMLNNAGTTDRCHFFLHGNPVTVFNGNSSIDLPRSACQILFSEIHACLVANHAAEAHRLECELAKFNIQL